MAVLNQQKRWLYLMEPHTASRAVAHTLKDQCGGCEHGHHHIGVPELTDRRRTQSIHNIFGYDIICTVRNPFDVLVTQWKFCGRSEPPMSEEKLVARYGTNKKILAKKRKQVNCYQPFQEWVEQGIRRYESHVCEPLKGLWKETTNVCYYEHLEEDLSTLFARPISLHRNQAHTTAGKKSWSEYWTGLQANDNMSDLLGMYQTFMTKYGYELDYDEDEVPFMTINQDVREQRCKILSRP